MEKAVRIAQAAEVTVEWLATGKGPMRPGSEVFGGRGEGLITEPAQDYAYVPLLDVSAAGGERAGVTSEEIADVLAFKRDWIKNELRASPQDLYLIFVCGESMEPSLRPGDITLVDRRSASVVSDGLYVIRMGGALLVKRLQNLPGSRIRVTSDNPAYEPFIVEPGQPRAEGLIIIGRIVWAARRM